MAGPLDGALKASTRQCTVTVILFLNRQSSAISILVNSSHTGGLGQGHHGNSL